MKLYVFVYAAYGHHELFAVMAESEEQARALIDTDAKQREFTQWPDDHFTANVYAVGQVVQFLTE